MICLDLHDKTSKFKPVIIIWSESDKFVALSLGEVCYCAFKIPSFALSYEKKNENNERNVHSNTTSLQKENCKIYAHFGMKLYFVLGRLAYKNSVRHINSNTNVRHINSNTNS